MPFELAAWVLQPGEWNSFEQRYVVAVGANVWSAIDAAMSGQLQQLADGVEPMLEPLDSTVVTLPLAIAADGVTVPIRPSLGTTSGKIVAARNQSGDFGTDWETSDPLWQYCHSIVSASGGSCIMRYLCLTVLITTGSISSRHRSRLPGHLD